VVLKNIKFYLIDCFAALAMTYKRTFVIARSETTKQSFLFQQPQHFRFSQQRNAETIGYFHLCYPRYYTVYRKANYRDFLTHPSFFLQLY
jgi:hypothetical protein